LFVSLIRTTHVFDDELLAVLRVLMCGFVFFVLIIFRRVYVAPMLAMNTFCTAYKRAETSRDLALVAYLALIGWYNAN